MSCDLPNNTLLKITLDLEYHNGFGINCPTFKLWQYYTLESIWKKAYIGIFGEVQYCTKLWKTSRI